MGTRSSYRTASHNVARALEAARVRPMVDEHGRCIEPTGRFGPALWLSSLLEPPP